MNINIRMASGDIDLGHARDLSEQWFDWHWKTYPADWPTDGNPMDPEKFQRILDDLAKLHARPKGGILLAWMGETPLGCVMYNEASPGVAVFNRMFVGDSGRGYGIGRRLLEHIFVQMRQDGYARVRYSSATFLTHARAMYEAAGFTGIPQPDGFPDDWRPYVYFMERSLAGDRKTDD